LKSDRDNWILLSTCFFFRSRKNK